MSDIVKAPSKAVTKRKQRLAAMQVSNVGSVQQSEKLDQVETRLTDHQVLELVKSAVGKDLDSLSEDEYYALSLQSQSVRDFVAQAAEIRDMKIHQHNAIIAQVTELIESSNQWLQDTVKKQKQHYADLSARSNAVSAEDLLKQITGCDSIDEYLNGGDDLPGELTASES